MCVFCSENIGLSGWPSSKYKKIISASHKNPEQFLEKLNKTLYFLQISFGLGFIFSFGSFHYKK